MNYQKIYNQIITHRKNHQTDSRYKETHHIVPKCLGGTDEKENLISLTAREHFICHWLLAKMYRPKTSEWYKMNHAFMMMKCNATNQKRYFNSRLYETCRKNFAIVMSRQSSEKPSQLGTQWINKIGTSNNKKIPKSSVIPDGWQKGRAYSKEASVSKQRVPTQRDYSYLRELSKKQTAVALERWQMIFTEWQHSNKSKKQFCIENNISFGAFLNAIKKFDLNNLAGQPV